MPEEKELIRRIAAGDPEAEQILFREFSVLQNLGIMVRRRVQTTQENQLDLVNEIAIGLLNNLRRGKFDPDKGSLTNYMWGVARNKVRDFLKPYRVRKRQHLELDEEQLQTDPSVESNRDDAAVVLQALKKLDKKYATFLELRYYKRMPIEDIAEQYSLTAKQTYSRINYALKLLRAEVENLNKFSKFQAESRTTKQKQINPVSGKGGGGHE